MDDITIPPEILSTYFPQTGGLPTEHSDDENNETLLAQIKHRIELVRLASFSSPSDIFFSPSSSLLDQSPSILANPEFDLKFAVDNVQIGCGQGDTTLVLAAQVGDQGSVDAVDPGDLDYAEWDLHAQTTAQIPHLLAILLQAIQEGWKKDGEEGEGNVSNVQKWKTSEMHRLTSQMSQIPISASQIIKDGSREIQIEREKRLNIMRMMYDVLDMSLENVNVSGGGVEGKEEEEKGKEEEEGKGIETMGVWVAGFVLGNEE
ncbi:hypothetical protein NHQ30_001469 [Ciborinia camelliae]|nr:hypothetical protein NHQ30_001469 [Ciborinia camelliae]